MVETTHIMKARQQADTPKEPGKKPVHEVSPAETMRLAMAIPKLKPAAKPAQKKPVAKPAPKKPAAKPVAKREQHPVTKLLKRMLTNGDYDAFRRTCASALEGRYPGLTRASLYTLLVSADLAEGAHDRLAETAGVLIEQYGSTEGFFFLAKSDFVRGNFDDAARWLLHTLCKKPRNADAAYLLAETLQLTGQTEAAWNTLEALLPKSRRAKTWLELAHLVQSQSDFIRMLHLWQEWQDYHRPAHYNKDAYEYLALGAIRAGDYALAELIWQDSLIQATGLEKGFGSLKPKANSYSSRRAELALIDLGRTLRAADIPMFLISGTLLGCVREGQLLGHDHDIDVGIWDDVDPDHFFSIIRKSGQFFVLSSRSPEIIRLRHVNGVGIDVFYHFRESDDYWHRGIKLIWHNSPFELVPCKFLNEEFLVPKDHDTYLTENYGDWHTPKIEFDSAFDTPNSEVVSSDEQIIHVYKMLMEAKIRGSKERITFYLDKLREFGGGHFADALE